MALITSANDMTGSSPLEALLLIGRFTDDDDVGRIDSEQDAAANPAIAFRLQFTRPVGRVAELGSLGRIERMTEQTPNISAVRPLRKTWRCLIFIIAVTVVATFVAGSFFYTPFMFGYVRLPGVVIAIASALVCSAAFCVCPRQPLWGKTLALILIVPSLWVALDSTTRLVCLVSWTGAS